MSTQKKSIDFDPYKVLQLQSGCTSSQVDKAYKKMALKWHPDKNPEQKERAQQMFLKIYRAFEFLKDEIARGDYDEQIAAKRRRAEFEETRQATSSKERLAHLTKLREAEKKAAAARVGEKRKAEAADLLIEELRREGAKMMQQMKEDHQKRESQPFSDQLRRQQKNQHHDITKELSNDVDELERALFGATFVIFMPEIMAVEEGNRSTEVVEKISTEVLRMNFMKRTTVRLEKQQRAQQQQKAREAIFSGVMAVDPPKYYPTAEHIDDDQNWTLGGIMSEWRYTVLENMRFGRFSFKGQNPEIEKLMEFHERRRLCLPDLEPKNSDDEEDVGESDSTEEGQISDDERPTQFSTGRKRKDYSENAGKKTFANSDKPKKRKWDGGRRFKVTGRYSTK
ncbi:hypothetical protein ACQ4LE_004103 [Meloidogyne hapla]